MNATPTFTKQGHFSTFATAALATVIALGLLSVVVFMFQREGKPLERVAAAERACAHHNYQSERQACINKQLAAAQATTVARQ